MNYRMSLDITDPSGRTVIIHKGCSVGPTTGLLENFIGYVLEGQDARKIERPLSSALFGGIDPAALRFIRGG